MSNILVIDDDLEVRTFFKTVLGRAGYAVRSAESGDEGVRLLREAPAELVIVDVLLPEKGGLQTIIELQHEFPSARLIAMSGGFRKTTDQDRSLADTLGVHRTPAKLSAPEDLLRVVREVLAG